MMSRSRFSAFVSLIALTAAAVLVGESSAAATAPVSPPLHTDGRFVVDQNGQRVHLAMASWYGAESEDYVVSGLQFQTIDRIASEVHQLGFNAIRLPWSNEMYETNPVVPARAITANPDLRGRHAMDVFDRVVHSLTGHGVMVVLDDHNSDAEWCCGDDGNDLWYNDRYPESSWISDWKGMVARYRDNPMVIGADLRNEPRIRATWGGPADTDWHAAAERGGNAVLSVNPDLLIFVEGVSYAGDLSGVAGLPVTLDVPNRVVYEAHDYAWFESHTSYADWYSHITPKWGYLVTGPNPQPLWVGEFGTCNTSADCVHSTDQTKNGSWFDILLRYLRSYSVDWSYWALNGTQSTGAGRTFGAQETYGILNPTWNGVASAVLMNALRSVMT